MQKQEDRKYFNFSNLYLIERVEKWRYEIFFYLLEKKHERIENQFCINLASFKIKMNTLYF